MPFLDDLRRDVRHALRSFRREPAFAASVVITLALAIGANTTMFGVVQRLMLAPPPGIVEADRIARVGLVFGDDEREPYTMTSTSYPLFRAVASLEGPLEGAAAFRQDTLTTGRGADRTEIAVVQVTGGYFSVLGVRPAAGRFFGVSEDEPPEGSAVAVLSHAYWRRRFASDRGVLGREIHIDDHPYTIIGVGPRGFNGTELSEVDAFIPLAAGQRARTAGWWNEPGLRLISVLVRQRAGVDEASTAAVLASRLRGDPDAGVSHRLVGVALESLVPGDAARRTPQGRIALWLSGVAIVVLLIATANVATLLLLRAARRRKEIAVRLALGASAGRLARHAVVESMVLALAGGAMGLLIARWLGDILRVTLLPSLAPAERLVDPAVLPAAFAATCVAGLLAGLAPLGQLARRNLAGGIRAGGGPGSSGRFVVQHTLVAMQVALCTVLLVGAGLFVRSLDRVRSQDLGFSTARLLRVELDFKDRLPAHERDRFHEDAARRLRTVPGVTAATVVQGMPFSSHHIPPISVPGVDPFSFGSGQPPIMYGATPEYLAMMDVELVAGRLITERDDRASAPVVLVNESMARNLWPNQSALGKCVRAGHPPGAFSPDEDAVLAATLPCREVVGVVQDSRARSIRAVRDEGRLMQYYVPFPQLPRAPFPDVPEVHAILVQTSGDAADHAMDVQRAVQSASVLPVYARVKPYQELIDPQLRSWRLGATVFTAFGLLALAVASLGLSGVISYLVTQRTREIGVRLALGGQRSRVGSLIVWSALRMAGIGALAGVTIAVSAAPLAASMLYETSPREPSIIVLAVLALLLVALLASLAPARRATRVDPMIALRSEG